MRDYGLIDGDSHILEPPTLWLDRLPATYRDRAPRLERFERGDAWVFEGVKNPSPFGFNAVGATPGGMKPADRRLWMRYDDEVNPALKDPLLRLKAMDEDGVRATVLYPSTRTTDYVSIHNKDRDFNRALIRAYNDWLSDFCATNLARLGLIALLPTTGIQDARDELRRALKLPGFRGVLLARWPNGDIFLDDDDDLFFGEVEEAGAPMNIHVGFSLEEKRVPLPPGKKGTTGGERHLDAPSQIKDLIQTGVFDRFPRLTVVFAETDCGWVPYVKEQIDDRFKRLEPQNRPDLKLWPSEYFERNLAFTFINDAYGIKNWRSVGLNSMIWSSDFAHSGTDWPHSWNVIEDTFADVPAEEKRQILVGNAARIYHWDEN